MYVVDVAERMRCQMDFERSCCDAGRPVEGEDGGRLRCQPLRLQASEALGDG